MRVGAIAIGIAGGLDQVDAVLRVGLSEIGIVASETLEELGRPHQTAEVLASALHADFFAPLESVGVEEREVEALADAVEQDVARGEVLVQKSTVVEMCGETGEALRHLFAESPFECGDVAHRMAVVRKETHIVMRGVEHAVAIAEEGHRFGAFKTALLEHQ